MTEWQEYLQRIVDAERAFVRREGGRTVLRGMSPMEMRDAAWEDPQGRLPCEPGYGTGGEVVELPLPSADDPVAVEAFEGLLIRMGRAHR